MAGATAGGETAGGGSSVVSTAAQVRVNDNPITWVFHQKGWIASVLILLVGWFPLPIPMTLTFGWMIDAIRRRARGEPQRLPQARDLLHMYRDGLVFWLAIAVIFVLPLVVFGVVFAFLDSHAVTRITNWVLGQIVNPVLPVYDRLAAIMNAIGVFGMWPIVDLLEPIPFIQLIDELIAEAAVVILFYAAYLAVASLGFLSGTVRFALSRKVGDYFHPTHNFSLAMAHLWRFVVVILLLTVLHYVNGILALSGIGSILVLTFGIWIAADIIGRLGARLRELKAVE
jgi:hypothetical protein